jgi:hypothetical protein
MSVAMLAEKVIDTTTYWILKKSNQANVYKK